MEQMKTLSDGYEVSSKSYYFLLEWNDQNNKNFISEKFGKQRLCELDKEEYMILWVNATAIEYNQMCGLSNENTYNVLPCGDCSKHSSPCRSINCQHSKVCE